MPKNLTCPQNSLIFVSKNIINTINGKDQKMLQEYLLLFKKSKIKINQMQFSTEKPRGFMFTL